jgi:hypothetical protein
MKFRGMKFRGWKRPGAVMLCSRAAVLDACSDAGICRPLMMRGTSQSCTQQRGGARRELRESSAAK